MEVFVKKLNDQIRNDMRKSSFKLNDLNLSIDHFSKKCKIKSNQFVEDRFRMNLFTTKFQQCNNIGGDKNTLSIKNKYDWDEKNNRNKIKDKKRPRSMAQFQKLTSLRDVECNKLYQATKVLDCFSIYGNWREKLIAEKVLLESGKRVELLMSEIREDYEKEHSCNVGTLTLKNFKFNLKKFKRTPHKTDFYVLMLINGLEVKTSKIARSTQDIITFNDEFKFKVKKNFNLRLEIHSIEMKDCSKALSLFTHLLPYTASLFEKIVSSQLSDRSFRAKSKMIYKNVYTYEAVVNEIAKTSFKLLGEFEINSATYERQEVLMKLSDNSPLKNVASYKGSYEDFEITPRNGFVTVGRQLNDQIIWNVQWCELIGTEMKFYNSPRELPMIPTGSLDLADFITRELTSASIRDCPRKRSVLINVTENEKNPPKLFLKFDNKKDLETWIKDINTILEFIRD